MIKKIAWSKEEEWILFLMHRIIDNKWAEIAKVLEGRTDNTIKNHWNASMSKKISNIEVEIESRLMEACEAANIEYLSCFAENSGSYPEFYKEFFTKFQTELLCINSAQTTTLRSRKQRNKRPASIVMNLSDLLCVL